MATIINNPPGTSEDSSVGVVVGLIVAAILLVLFFLFAWPALQNNPGAPATGGENPGASANINVTLPTGSPAAIPAAY